ncbi:MAG: hypothetical protein CV088_09375 [Nitrospira sp. LK70]|nr:hypothetical protein [Nitrospira sp. LK70]
MPNTAVQGRVLFTGTTNGILDLIVEAYDVDAITGDQLLGTNTTNASGNYSITYPASRYGTLEWLPDIVVRVFDKYKRLLHETIEHSNVTTTTLTMPDIELHPNNIRGLLVTNATINPAGTPIMHSAGNAITFLIDNENGWREITDQVNIAVSTINFTMLFFEVPDVITKFPVPMSETGAVVGEKLQEAFKQKASHLTISALFNDFSPDGFGLFDTANEVSNYFRNTNVQLRLYRRLILAPMHAKILILDGQTAYLVGSPIMQEYWDAQTHTIRDPRRGTMGISNQIKVPIHEVTTKIQGPAAGHLDETFATLWNKPAPMAVPVTGATPFATHTESSTASVQVIRTLPDDASTDLPYGETGILEAYQRAIANAADFIYIEDQYFTSFEIVDAMLARLDENKKLQIILLLNIKVDLPGYSSLQPRVVDTFLRGVGSLDAIDRVGIFTLWSHEPGTPTIIMRNYVHSKTAIVDDQWATVGSANTDGASLNATQVFNPFLTSIVQLGRFAQHANPNQTNQPFRAVETNIAIYNGVDGQPSTTVIDELRRQLWREHLGYMTDTDDALMTRPGGGWWQLWSELAAGKLAGLSSSNLPSVLRQRILPYRPQSNATDNLAAMGIYPGSNLKVQDEVESFDFATGKWR